LDEFKETTGYRKLKEETLAPTLCRTCFGRVYGPVVNQTTEWWWWWWWWWLWRRRWW